MEFELDDLLRSMQDGVYFLDQERRITFWNPAAERITGYRAEDVIGSRCSDNLLVHVDETGASLCKSACPASATLTTGEPRQAEVFLKHHDGHRVPVHAKLTPLRSRDGTIVGVAELFTDASDQVAQRERIAELEKLALLDPLTQLSNRRHLVGELQARLDELERYGLSFGVVLLDLDDFKAINDRYGHDAGDLALRTISGTLRASARPFDVFGRWGGEEFVGVIRNVEGRSVQRFADRCRALIGATEIRLDEQTIQVTASVGATLAHAGDTPDSLVRRADALMYASKRDGRDRVTFDED